VTYELKRYETRSLHFFTDYRGELAIHAVKTKRKTDVSELRKLVDPLSQEAVCLSLINGQILMNYLPYGCIACVCELTDCIVMTPEFIEKQSPLEIAVGLWKPGRVALKLENTRKLFEPIPIKRGWQSWGQTTPEMDQLIAARI
jgi:hypothetical protein